MPSPKAGLAAKTGKAARGSPAPKRRPGRPRTVTSRCKISGAVARPSEASRVIEVTLQTPQRFRDIVTAFKTFGAKEFHMQFFSDTFVIVGGCPAKPHPAGHPPSCLYFSFPVRTLCRYYVRDPGATVSLSRTNMDGLSKKIGTAHEKLCIAVTASQAGKTVSFETTQQHGQKTATWHYNQITPELVQIPAVPGRPPRGIIGGADSADEDDADAGAAAESSDESSEADSDADSDSDAGSDGAADAGAAAGSDAEPDGAPAVCAPLPPVIAPYQMRWGGDANLVKGITRDVHTQTALECVRFCGASGADVLTYKLATARQDHHGESTIDGRHCRLRVSPGCVVQGTFYSNQIAMMAPLMRRSHTIEFYMDNSRPMVGVLSPENLCAADADDDNLLDSMSAVVVAEMVNID